MAEVRGHTRICLGLDDPILMTFLENNKRLTKKLYEIKELQQSEDNDDVLEKNQMEKIRQKHKYEEELRDLKTFLGL